MQMSEVAKPPFRFGVASLALFGGAAVWFAVCLNWHLPVGLMLPGASIPSCLGLVLGIIGVLPGNPARILAILGAVVNGAGLIWVLDRWLLWGI
jgi:type IV secretory pathway VirB2 component (pilin)